MLCIEFYVIRCQILVIFCQIFIIEMLISLFYQELSIPANNTALMCLYFTEICQAKNSILIKILNYSPIMIF